MTTSAGNLCERGRIELNPELQRRTSSCASTSETQRLGRARISAQLDGSGLLLWRNYVLSAARVGWYISCIEDRRLYSIRTLAWVDIDIGVCIISAAFKFVKKHTLAVSKGGGEGRGKRRRHDAQTRSMVATARRGMRSVRRRG